MELNIFKDVLEQLDRKEVKRKLGLSYIYRILELFKKKLTDIFFSISQSMKML